MAPVLIPTVAPIPAVSGSKQDATQMASHFMEIHPETHLRNKLYVYGALFLTKY